MHTVIVGTVEVTADAAYHSSCDDLVKAKWDALIESPAAKWLMKNHIKLLRKESFNRVRYCHTVFLYAKLSDTEMIDYALSVKV